MKNFPFFAFLVLTGVHLTEQYDRQGEEPGGLGNLTIAV